MLFYEILFFELLASFAFPLFFFFFFSLSLFRFLSNCHILSCFHGVGGLFLNLYAFLWFMFSDL